MNFPWKQGSWGQQGAQLGPTGPRWAPCWLHEPCYLGHSTTRKSKNYRECNKHWCQSYFNKIIPREPTYLTYVTTFWKVNGITSNEMRLIYCPLCFCESRKPSVDMNVCRYFWRKNVQHFNDKCWLQALFTFLISFRNSWLVCTLVLL